MSQDKKKVFKYIKDNFSGISNANRYSFTRAELADILMNPVDFSIENVVGFNYDIALDLVKLRYLEDFKLMEIYKPLIELHPELKIQDKSLEVMNQLLEESKQLVLTSGAFTQEQFNYYDKL